MDKEIRQAELATLAGVRGNSAHRMFHTKLRPAQTPDGKRLYLNHPLVQRYIHSRTPSRTRPRPPEAPAPDPFADALACATPPIEVGAPEAPEVAPVTPAPQLPELLERQQRARTDTQLHQLISDTNGALPRDLDDLGAIPLRELLDAFGTLDGLAVAVKASKQFAEMKSREAEMAKKRGEWVARDFVSQVLVGLIDLAFTRSVGEAPTALSQQVIARVMSGGDELGPDVEAMIRNEYSGILQSLRDKFVQELKANG